MNIVNTTIGIRIIIERRILTTCFDMEKTGKELMEEAHKIGQSQVIHCKCGKVFAACMLPFAHLEADWMRDIRKYTKQGYQVSIMKNGSWEWCDTKKCVTKKELTLFS